MADLLARITINSEICHGKPTIRGLRYPVETILELLSSGMTSDDILEDYPDLEQEDILAVLAFAASTTKDYIADRAKRGNRAKFDAALAKVADVEPEEGDKL
jgi:uncharacterized protein (DUF433 family)